MNNLLDENIIRLAKLNNGLVTEYDNCHPIDWTGETPDLSIFRSIGQGTIYKIDEVKQPGIIKYEFYVYKRRQNPVKIPDAKKSLLALLSNPKEYSSLLAEWRGVPINIFLSEVAVVLKYILLHHDNDLRLRKLLIEKLSEISDDPKDFS